VGLADGERITLDGGPRWEEGDTEDVLATPRAIKNQVRAGARRWFYGNRVWVNHDDLIFFRSWPDPGVPPLSLEESRAFASFVGIGGGVVKIGDKLLDVAAHPEWIDVLRRLLPIWPDGARPLDVLERDYPERWLLHVDAPAGQWDIAGLFNWGKNRDFTVSPPAPMPEQARTLQVPCASECLAYELWSERFLGRMTGPFTVEVPPRQAMIVSLRQPTGAPQLLGTNRHVTQGATDLGPLAWDAAGKALSGTLVGSVGTATAPWEYHLAFYAPAPFAIDRAEVDGVVAPSVSQDGEVVRLVFALPPEKQDATVAFRLYFK
jgi:hypothetical protein